MRKKYLEECEIIRQNCEYTAEAHHIIAEKNKRMQVGFQLVPAISASLSSLLVVGTTVPEWVGWIAVISAVVTAVASVLNPLKDYYDHLNAAKNFTALKHDARNFKNVSSSKMNDNNLVLGVENLHQRYNDLIKFVPPTDDKSFEKAVKRIKEGIHNPNES
jgi:hypothetical protein